MNSDLFLPEYTIGNLDIIDFCAKYIGMAAVFIISIVGFCIVNFTIAKNALNGWYAVSPKIWDRVDEIKKAGLREGAGKNAGNNEIMKFLGYGQWFILSLLPNVKAMTDFDGELLDPKAYFMKAIPLACIQIFVGVFIYFGYPSQVAEKFARFGTGMFDIILTNTDPVAFVESLPGKLAVLKFSTDGALDDESKCINEIAKSATSTYLGKVSDVTKEKRMQLALDIESWVMQTVMQECGPYMNMDKYKMTVTSSVATGTPNLDYVHGKERDGTYTFAYTVPFDNFDHGSTKDVADTVLRIDIMFSPVAQKGAVTAVECTASVPRWENTDGGIKITFAEETGTGFGLYASSKGSGRVEVGGEEVDVLITVNGATLTVKPKYNKSIEGATSITNISGLYYKHGTTTNKIVALDNSSSSVIFKPTNDTSINPWGWGEGPARSDAESETTAGVNEGGSSDTNGDATSGDGSGL